ncbi:glutathione S-transferase family protein [Leptospira sp. 96542]|nr:glutathione S-transferase family protein [Leptospira sp. 96542]
MLQLYSNARSTYSKRVHIYLKFRKIEYETIPVALEKLENRKKPYILMNPYGKVPMLKDEDFLLSESTVIIRYLEDKYNFQDPFFPTDIKKRATLNQKINQAETEFCFPGSIIYFAKKFKPEETWDKNRMKESSKRLGRHLEILASELAGNEFLFQNSFGILEVMYAPFIEHIEMMDTKIPQPVLDWKNRVIQRVESLG